MIIVYESKTGFTKKYADMLGRKTGFKVISTKDISTVDKKEEIIFLGWLKVGQIQGLNKVRNHNIKIVCASGNGRTADPDNNTVASKNKISDKAFFYLRGGCFPLRELKGMDKIMLSMFVKMLKGRKDKDEKTEEAISTIVNGHDGVDEKNLSPVLEWLNLKKRI